MTPQEAISALKQINLKRVHPFYDWEEMSEVRDTAINALEKQIPKKPIKYDDCEQFFIECPCCQKRFDSRLGYKGCPYCLQAIRLE